MKAIDNKSILRWITPLLLLLSVASAPCSEGGDEDLDFQEPFPSPPSLRTARLKVKIDKTSIVLGTSGPEWRRETVCFSTADMDVYDLRGLDDANIASRIIVRCNSTTSRGRVDLLVGAYISFVRKNTFEGTPAEYKNFTLASIVIPSAGEIPDWAKRWETVSSSTRDLSTRSATLTFQGNAVVYPKDGSQETEESFSITATFDDTNG